MVLRECWVFHGEQFITHTYMASRFEFPQPENIQSWHTTTWHVMEIGSVNATMCYPDEMFPTLKSFYFSFDMKCINICRSLQTFND